MKAEAKRSFPIAVNVYLNLLTFSDKSTSTLKCLILKREVEERLQIF